MEYISDCGSLETYEDIREDIRDHIKSEGDNIGFSNPCNWFISGSEKKEYITGASGGLSPFGVILKTDNWIPVSMIIFATDIEQAKLFLKQACKFRVKCFEQYKYNHGKALDIHSHGASIAQAVLKILNGGRAFEEGGKEYKLTLFPLPINQFYSVGWADNGTIF